MPPLLQPGDPLDKDFDANATRAQYELLSNALERFRKRWHSEYLLSLREKTQQYVCRGSYSSFECGPIGHGSP